MVRAHTEELTDAIRRALSRHVVDDAEAESANFSLRLSDNPKVFHTLYRGACVVVASPDPRRVLTALIRNLEAYTTNPPGLVGVQARVLVRDGMATLVPTLINDDLRALNRRMANKGIRQLDAETALLDLERREVVVTSILDVDRAPLDAALADVPQPRRADPPLENGRYPLARWAFMEFWEPLGPYTRPTAARRAALVLRDGPRAINGDLLAGLAALFETVEAEGIDPQSTADVVSLLRL